MMIRRLTLVAQRKYHSVHVILIYYLRMERKYVGLKLDEMEKGWNIYMVDQAIFDGCRNKKFTLRAMTIEYDNDNNESHLDNLEEYNIWKINEMTYVCIAEYYKNQSGINGDGVMCYKPDDDCNSDEPGDEWEGVGEGKVGLKKK